MKLPITLSLFALSSCIMAPTDKPMMQGDATNDGSPDLSSLEDQAQRSDLSNANDPYYPIPSPDSGDVAWWLMSWIESPDRPAERRCESSNPVFAIIAEDDGQLSDTITISYVRGEPCLYWGGAGPLDLQFHLTVRSIDQWELGDVYVARGFSLRTRAPAQAPIEAGGVTFDSRGSEDGFFYTFGPGGWGHGWPMAADGVDQDIFMGEVAPPVGFVTVGSLLESTLYPTAFDRRNESNADPTLQNWTGRTRFRTTTVDGVPTQYVAQSFTDSMSGQTSCEEFWYQQGIGPYANVAYGVTDYDQCLTLLAADTASELSAPIQHIEANWEFTDGYGLRIAHCIGPDCTL